METNATFASPNTGYCTECGKPYPSDDLMRYENRMVCASCKDAFIQRLREGAPLAHAVRYGGFWIRALALILDGVILLVVSLAINGVLALALPFPAITNPSSPNPAALGAIFARSGLSMLINMALGVTYQAFFLTRSGATPGKMAVGLKVIRADGGPITVGLAIGRYFCYLLDSLTLCIGYLIAAFDSQKRALHDFICNTRVIRVN